MIKRMVVIIGITIFLSGCATAQKDSLTNRLQVRVGELERQVQLKDEQINELKYEVKDLSYEIDRLKDGVKSKSGLSSSKTKAAGSLSSQEGQIIRVPVSIDLVQKALKNAGYYDAEIDGKLGARTKTAIAKFQEAHGLKADGILGKQTWAALQSFSE